VPTVPASPTPPPPETCPAASSGFTCIRPKGHGDIHVDPHYMSKAQCNLWILEPFGPDEETGRKPMSGYRLLTDTGFTT
jgi:hypothetical protein